MPRISRFGCWVFSVWVQREASHCCRVPPNGATLVADTDAEVQDRP